jgi:hypothetical protein
MNETETVLRSAVITSRQWPDPLTLGDVFDAIRTGEKVGAIEAFSFWYCESRPGGFDAAMDRLCEESPSVERTINLYNEIIDTLLAMPLQMTVWCPFDTEDRGFACAGPAGICTTCPTAIAWGQEVAEEYRAAREQGYR